jgi:hypothetical protein
MMNENSPICARVMPAWTEMRTLLPVKKAPTETPMVLPTMTSNDSASTGPQWSTMTAGSSSIPTETKKTAANMSRTGWTRCSMGLASPDSAMSEPAMNAPSATE